MEKIIIEGGKPLAGEIKISGAKNACLPILFATLLTDEECILENVPELADIETTIHLLTYLGKKIKFGNGRVVIAADGLLREDAPYDLVRKMRASVLVLGPLLARRQNVRVAMPGGCAIGVRPIDIHLDAFRKIGAEITLNAGDIVARSDKFYPADVRLRFPSVGATENILLAAAGIAEEITVTNVATEPEVVDLIRVLGKMGAEITGNRRRIKIKGKKKLSGFVHRVIPDRIETGTYLIAAAIAGGWLVLTDTDARFLTTVIDKLKKTGMNIETNEKHIKIVHPARPLKPVSVRTAVYPGFPTDLQAQWLALMATVPGRSTVTETIFENRFLHVAELRRLGADLTIVDNKVLVNGGKKLVGAPVMVSDLRAGAALVLAGLAASGKTIINRVYHLDRGYENLEKKLSRVGAEIKRVQD